MKVGFLGAGNMGGALARAAAKAGKFEILLFDRDSAKAEALAKKIGAASVGCDTLASKCDVIFLGVKPNIFRKKSKFALYGDCFF